MLSRYRGGFNLKIAEVAQDVKRNAEPVCLRGKEAIGKADKWRRRKVLLYQSVFFSELVERDRGFMMILILNAEFPRLAATANPGRVRLCSVLPCVCERGHVSVR